MSRDALIVGINRYSHLNPLQAPARDAEAIAQILYHNSDFNKIIRLPEIIQTVEGKKQPIIGSQKSVSRESLKEALEQLFLPKSQQVPTTALFYFSGHGIPDKSILNDDKGYLATSDTNPSNADVTGLSLRWLCSLLQESPIKQQIIWLDCCHSGSLLVNLEAANPGYSNSKDRCFIASSRDFESSYEDLNSDYSVLTKALLEGLDSSRSSHDYIKTSDLVAYVNQALKGELQTPLCTLFGEPINLTRGGGKVREIITKTVTVSSEVCPYKGLEYFDYTNDDPKYFFGREKFTDQLLNQVRTSQFLALVGASGSGKSSVLRAGLLHQIQQGKRISQSNEWRICITRPESEPMDNLALAFLNNHQTDEERTINLANYLDLLNNKGAKGLQTIIKASSAPKVILVIDQFEEVFTLCLDLEKREKYLNCLMNALGEDNPKLCLIIAMRADFVGKCLERDYSGLYQRIENNLISVLPMATEEMKTAICRPAELVGLEVEETLVTEILNDVGKTPNILPLLQYTLKELWKLRQGNQMTLSAYQKQLNRIEGTLDKRATEIYNGFEETEKLTVQHIFLQLTQLGEGTEDTRRRVFQSDLVAEPQHSAEKVAKIVNRLADKENRLLVTNEVGSMKSEVGSGLNPVKRQRQAVVDVCHEALIRNWQLLRRWLEENRELLRTKRKIEGNAEAWREGEGYVLEGFALREAIEFWKQHQATVSLSNTAQKFIKKSQKARLINRLKVGAGFMTLILVIVGIVDNNVREAKIQESYRILGLDEGRTSEFEVFYQETDNMVVAVPLDSQEYSRRISLTQEYSRQISLTVEELVKGCGMAKKVSWLRLYFKERLFGNCRSLNSVSLVNVNLSDANLRGANLTGANLSGTNLSGANLSSANLSSANLSGANLSGANLTGADLAYVHFKYNDGKDSDNDSLITHLRGIFEGDFDNQQIKSACNWQEALFKAEWNWEEKKYVAIEPDNSNFIKAIEQDKGSDPEVKPHCSRWK